ncbi:MFS transporter [Streptomyces scabiei]|uniref:MFS transporter n=1 Tax=Streptomyces scabiei TaxID=1930 RepID=UPI0033F6F593
MFDQPASDQGELGCTGGAGGAALLVAEAFFMENLDSAVNSTAAPDMATPFRTGPETVGVTMTAYPVAPTVFIPVSGRAADSWGTRPVFAWAIAVFTVASALCAAADGLAEPAVTRGRMASAEP